MLKICKERQGKRDINVLDPMYWINNSTNLIWLRNHVVAPLSEEFTFRSCMLPLLLQCFQPSTAVLVCPLFFGVGKEQAKEKSTRSYKNYLLYYIYFLFWFTAHFHHMIERIKSGLDVQTAFLSSCKMKISSFFFFFVILKWTVAGFHFTYTTIFGAYSAYLFYKTGHFASSFIVHAFCNHMGVPDLRDLANYKGNQRMTVVSLFFVGFFTWCMLLEPLTEPGWYYNELSWRRQSRQQANGQLRFRTFLNVYYSFEKRTFPSASAKSF